MPEAATRNSISFCLGAAALLLASEAVLAQFGGQGGRFGGGGTPITPEAVPLPDDWERITGPGPMYISDQSHAPGYTPADFSYQAQEYFVSGTANDAPYTTRVVIR
jgi:hypothetical protein